MSKCMRRATAMTGVAGLLAVAGVTAGAGPAVAVDEVRFSTQDMVFPPGTNPRLGPWLESGTADGRVVIALSTKPLTGAAGDGAGVPKGFTVDPLNCTAAAGVTAVYLCQDGGMFPQVTSPLNAPNLTTVHWGFAYVPQGGSLAAAIETARTAGARPADATDGTGKAVVHPHPRRRGLGRIRPARRHRRPHRRRPRRLRGPRPGGRPLAVQGNG